MPPRLLRRFFVFFAALAASAALPSVARAQEITIVQSNSLPRISADGKPVTKRPSGLTPEGVSYQDCLDDQRIQFAIQQATPEAGSSFQVWAGLAGANCSEQVNRDGSNRTCWQLVTEIPRVPNPVVEIPVRAIMSGAPPFRPAEPGVGADVCGKIDLATLSVQFLYFSPGQLASPSRTAEISVQVDTVGPEPPTGIDTLPGNQRIIVTWDNISGEGGVTALTGVKAYCDPEQAAPAETATSATEEDAACEEVPSEDAGDEDGGDGGGTITVCSDAGASSGASPASTGGCYNANLAPPGKEIIPDDAFNAKYECGSLFGSTGASLVATAVGGAPLVNDTHYAVAVAGTDAFGNVGPLSSLHCQWPELTNDFWENYKDSGGGAGGGLCAATHPGAPVGSLSALAVIGVATASVLRRRRGRR